jgi:hypothetical protein
MVAYPAGDYHRRLKNAAGDLNSSPVVSLGSFASDIKKNFRGRQRRRKSNRQQLNYITGGRPPPFMSIASGIAGDMSLSIRT